jgi:VanZ family protein
LFDGLFSQWKGWEKLGAYYQRRDAITRRAARLTESALQSFNPDEAVREKFSGRRFRGCAWVAVATTTPGMPLSSSVSKWRWLPPIALAVMIFMASSRSHVAGPHIRGGDKVAHFAVYGLLATLVIRAMRSAEERLRGPAALMAVVVASLYGITDEWHQSFTPGRSVEVADWLADTSGAALAVTLYCRWAWYRRWLEKPLFFPRKPRLESPELPAPISAP